MSDRIQRFGGMAPVRSLILCAMLLLSACGGDDDPVAPTAPPRPTVDSFAATPASIESGESAMLSWTTTNATSVSINNGVTGTLNVDGSTTVTPTSTTIYTLTATGDGGTATATATVTVTEPPPPPQQAAFEVRIENVSAVYDFPASGSFEIPAGASAPHRYFPERRTSSISERRRDPSSHLRRCSCIPMTSSMRRMVRGSNSSTPKASRSPVTSPTK